MPLHLPGFVEFNCRKWGLKAHAFDYRGSSGALPRLWGTYYLDSRGRVTVPPLCAYLPVAFEPTPTEQRHRLYRQWLAVASEMSAEMKRRGVAGLVALPPEVTDARPWAWQGFRTLVAYTLFVPFPWSVEEASHSVRKQVAKATREGFVSERSADVRALVASLRGTEERQGISYRMSESDLNMALSLLGPDHLRIYLCRSPSGEVASGRAILHVPGSRAVDWLAGTVPSYLASGATQHLVAFALRDLQEAGATGFDFAGANIARVAQAKMDFGATLVPYVQIEPLQLKTIALNLIKWGRSWFNGFGRSVRSA